MGSAATLFWICLILVAYTYFFYPLVLWIAYSTSQIFRDLRYLTGRRDRRARSLTPGELPSVSLIVPAHNEEASLPEKLADIQQLDYPVEKFETIFVSDGSTDRTNEILAAHERRCLQTVYVPVRKGKANALNQAVARAKHDVLVFSDASTLFTSDAIKKLVRYFSDPAVGVVCGALEFRRTAESRETEGVYWKYESMLRLMEARLDATLTASGAIYALRRECYRELPPDTLIDDLMIPMTARRLGYRVLYDPEAVATDVAAPTIAGEFARRVRLAAGSFRALRELIRVPLSGFACLAFFSHKLLRWILPFLLIGLLMSSAALWKTPFFGLAFVAQLSFYLLSAVGFLCPRWRRRVRYALLGYFLLAMNVAFLVGFVRSLLREKEVPWQQVN